MATIHDYLTHFPRSNPYKPRARLDHADLFQAFEQALRKDPSTKPPVPTNFVMQVKAHPNQCNHGVHISWVDEKGWNTNEHQPQGARRANAWRNYRTSPGVGHSEGLFFELNLYTTDATYVSNHHMSQCEGNAYSRDTSHDGDTVSTKGTHWKIPDYQKVQN